MSDYPPSLVRIPLAPRSKAPLVVRWSSLPPGDPTWDLIFSASPEHNVGLRLDHLVVIDCDCPERVAWWLEQGHPTEFMSRGNPERRSFWYRLPVGEDLHTTRHPGWEVRAGAGSYCVVPPSIHPSGRPYEWLGPPVDEAHWWEIPEAPVDFLARLRPVSTGNGTGFDVVEAGGRDDFLASVGGSLRRLGLGEAGILAVLEAVNQAVCVPPKPRRDVLRVAHSVARYDAEQTFEIDGGPQFIGRARKKRR